MARGVYSTSNYFVLAAGVITATPLSMACWYYITDVTREDDLIGVFYTAGAAAFPDGWFIRNDGSKATAVVADGAATSTAQPSAATVNNTWMHIGGVFVSATSRYGYLNGVASSQSTANRAPSATVDKTAIGCRINQNNAVAAVSDYSIIAEAGFWNVALTAADMLQLAAGYSPLSVRPESLVAYYPLIRGDANGDEPDLMGGLTMVEQGTVAVAAHARVFYPGRRRGFGKAVAAGYLIAPKADHYRRMAWANG